MEYHLLGNTDLRVSRLGLGTVELGMPYGLGNPVPPPDTECIALLRSAFDAGITFFDTAAAYGRSEELIGMTFADLSTRPIIATKAVLHPPEATFPLRGNALREHLTESIESSLRKLRFDALDLLQIHSVETRFISEDILAILADCVDSGKVRYWGVSTYGEEAPLEVLDYPQHLHTLQVAYNLLDDSLEKEVLPRCAKQGTGVIFRSVFLKGVLSARYHQLPSTLSPLKEAAQQVATIATRDGIDLPDLALRFAAYSPFAHVTLFGTSSAREMAKNLQAYAAGPLPHDIIDDLATVEVTNRALLNPGNWED